ncbi:MAG TPA: EAL domain-containing protein, partial [Novosphingobium sp.]|nr:EAL domain-containing protein [Novosphingobium sp.]
MRTGGGQDEGRKRQYGSAGRDFIALGITLACIILFVGAGGPVLADAVGSLIGSRMAPNALAVNALLLNIALIIFSWRRYGQLRGEIAERRKAEEVARRLAETDALTGCLNRRSLPGAVDALKAHAETRGEAIAFLMIDLDNFKQVNDFHGHNAGDGILRESAARIGCLLPEGSLIARLGGDEFAAIIAFDPAHPERVETLAAAIVEDLCKPQQTHGLAVHISASLGITRSDTLPAGQNADAQSLLHMADIAMYQAKRQGKNRYFWFEPLMESELRLRNELESGIRRGIPAGEFEPWYEQQVDIATGQLTGFEMLARWNSPSLGMVSPEIFIPVAEDIGVIGDLSESVIARALRDARDWDPSLTLSVNISPVQLRDPWFAQKLLKLLVQARFPPERLEIEITETCLDENVGGVGRLIASLKNQGIRVSLDDFGTGYSSLAQLRNLPFDQIKIDRSFVCDMDRNADSRTIVEAIAALGRGLGLPITVEGIESREVLDRLRALGELKGQGYLYGRPESAEVTRQRLANLDLLAQ